jgi:hypothetical protein
VSLQKTRSNRSHYRSSSGNRYDVALPTCNYSFCSNRELVSRALRIAAICSISVCCGGSSRFRVFSPCLRTTKHFFLLPRNPFRNSLLIFVTRYNWANTPTYIRTRPWFFKLLCLFSNKTSSCVFTRTASLASRLVKLGTLALHIQTLITRNMAFPKMAADFREQNL